MRKILLLVLGLMMAVPCYPANEWQKGTGEDVILGSENISDIDKISFENIVDPLDRLLSNYLNGCVLKYASASTLTVTLGEVVCSNAAGTVRKFRKNTSALTLTWADIDTGAEAISTTYYVYLVADADATTFTGKISTNSTTPNGVTYYKNIGTFYNDASGNISNDDSLVNYDNAYSLRLGDWVSKTPATAYQASTDGFVVGYGMNVASGAYVTIQTDSSNPPTTYRIYASGSGASNSSNGCMIKRNDYYKVTLTGGSQTVYWIPLEREN